MHDFSSHQRLGGKRFVPPPYHKFKFPMPVLRNVVLGRRSGRLGKQTPVIYDGDGWPTSESINYVPNGEPLNDSMLQYLASFPKSDRPFPHSLQQERKPSISSDGLPYDSSIINTSYLPPPRERYPRPHESGYIPRPRNAFIIFRSSYVSTASDEGQHELSKQAGTVWNRMTEIEKGPFNVLADFEKKQHQAMYPDYIYCPAARRKSITSIKQTGTDELTPTNTTPLVSSKATAPEIPSAAPALRPPYATVQTVLQRFLQLHSISPFPPVSQDDPPMQEGSEDAYPEHNGMDLPLLETGTQPSDVTLMEDDDFVPTADIPDLELTPPNKEEPEHTFDLFMRPSHLDRIPEQFEFYPNKSTAAFAHLPPMPNLHELDAASAGDVPPSCSRTPSPPSVSSISVPEDISEYYTIPDFWWLTALNIPQHPAPNYSSCSRTLLPANFLTTTTTRSTSVTSSDVPDFCQQKLTSDLLAPRQSAPGSIWSLDRENDHNDSTSKDMMPEDQNSFMSSLFDFDSLQ